MSQLVGRECWKSALRASFCLIPDEVAPIEVLGNKDSASEFGPAGLVAAAAFLINGEGAEHDVVVGLYGVRFDQIVGKGASSTIFLSPPKPASSPITARFLGIGKQAFRAG